MTLRISKAKARRMRFVPKVGTRHSRRKTMRLRRGMRAKLARMTHLFPPQEGRRRPEFSSALAGKWSAEAGQ